MLCKENNSATQLYFLVLEGDTIQERSNSDFDVKCATIQFYGNSHNS